ncbi:DUF6131 family protein [Nocardia jejuensis]|uniref:DUF6131 family protein n=1 Tax=Nocardia jejuensis TaxID=328049 RepID=UPI000A8881F0|nr:DUF6131 family protein [Nocardia jejuensis]
MIVLGILLLGAGFFFGNILFDIAGALVLMIGGALMLAGRMGHRLGGRRHYY